MTAFVLISFQRRPGPVNWPRPTARPASRGPCESRHAVRRSENRGRDPGGLAGGERGAHDPYRSSRDAVAVDGPAGSEQISRVAAHQCAQRNVVGLVWRLLETAVERRRIVEFARPGAERNAIGKPRASAQVLGRDLIDRIDMSRLASPELGAGRHDVRALVTRDAADHVEIGPGLAASAHLGGTDAG